MYKILKKIQKISLLKTFLFNFHYFGFKGLYVLPVLIGKHVELRDLKGKITVENFKTGVVQIGMNDIGIFPIKTTVASIQNNGEIIFKGKAELGIGTHISNGGILKFGDNFTVSA